MGYHVGDVNFSKTFSDIDIQTETPTASNAGGGFVHKSFNKTGPYGIVAGLFYDDFILDDWSDKIAKSEDAKSPYKWFVFPWHKNGSLNNDCTRPANLGTQTALLKKKVISNLRYSITTFKASNAGYTLSPAPQLFSSDEVSVVKLGDEIYQGNVDTMLTPDNPDGVYCAFNNSDIHAKDVDTPFNFNTLNRFLKTYSKEADSASNEGLYGWNGTKWENKDGQYGDHYVDIVVKKDPVRMKYKSTPHLVLKSTVMDTSHYNLEYDLPIMEVRRDLSGSNLTTFENTVFGGQSEDAFKENTWVPCGEPVKLVSGSALTIKYSYGDTYFQRWDCLKTYPFTHEDTNQIVEIGSFMLETHSNIDGRYDRNRGQMNNLNMTPQNFNLLNPVYSQVDNFFSYKIMDADYYKNQKYPNQITWSKTKESAADTDLWTNVTLASVLELDGDKGEITSLQRLNDQLLCFQDKGISQILYNENTQISTTEGVPIEIANSGKVQGKRYLSGTVGCSNKWSICKTPAGLYFMDSNEKSIYRLGDSLQNISQQAGFNTWCKQNIPSAEIAWNPLFPVDTNSKSAFISIYDSLNQDVLFVNKNTALAYSEKFSVFTSFYDYGGASFFCNLDDTGIWVHRDNEYGLEGLWQLWKHQAGAYGVFYGNKKPYWMTLVGNPEPQADKIFTNIEFRAYTDMSNPGDHSKLPFDYIETWNEYQHGFANLDTRSGHYRMIHHTSDGNAHLAKKFRIWRCDIPRDNAEYDFNADAAKGIYRTGRHPMDRMRNPWLYIKLYKAEAGYRDALLRSEIHDLIMTYYS